MFGSKSLLSCKRAGTLCLFYASKARKTKEISSIGVVKYNKENKYLFGDLLETRAQRRKTLKKVNKSIFKNLKKHVSDIKSKLLNALLNETRFLTLSKVYCRSNYPNSCLFSSNEFLRLNPISYLSPVSTNVKYISVSPDGGSRLNEERDAYDIGIARAERWNKCLTRIAIPVSTPHYSDRFINNIKSTNVIYCHDNKSHLNDPRRISAVYRTKKKNRLLDNVAFKPYSFAKRFIHRRTKLKTLGLQRNKKDLEDERHSFNNSLEDVMEKSFKSCNQNLAGTKLSSSKNHVIRTKYTPDGIKSIGLSRRSDNSAHKRKSILPKWDNRLSVNKKSIYFTVNPKKIHTNSKYQFKHRNNTNGLSRNSKKENGFLERHDKFPTCDFSIESLAIKDQKQKDGSDWLNSNPPVSLANSQKKVYRIPELVRGGLNSYKFNKKVIFSRNRSLIKNDSKFTTCGLSHEETRENRSQSSRNEYSQLSHFLQKTSSKNIKKNDLVPFCNLEKYLKNMRGLDTPKSIAKSPHFSKMSPHKTVDKFEEDSNPLLINKNQIYSSFWPNRPKTSKFTNTKETSLQGKYSSTGDISSLLFPKKYSIGSTLPHSDRKFNQGYKFKVHNNTLKASNDSFFKVPCNMIVGKNKKPNHILPVTDNAFFVASNELNDGLECIKSTDKSNKNSSDCNIENALKYDIPTTNNVKPNINLNKYFSVVQSGNPINGDNNQHVDLNSNPKKARISDLIFQRTLCRKESSLKSCVESCKVDNSSPEIYQEKENMGAESKKILEKSTFNLFNGSHTHNNNYCEENVKKRMLQKEPEVTIHCNDLKLKENRIEKPKEPQLSIDFLKNSSSNKFTDNPGINYEINKLSKPKLVESIFNYKRSLHEVNHKVSDAVIKNASDENVFKAKDKTEKSHSGLNLSKSPRNENLSFRFEHSLLDSNNSLNVLTNEKHEIKLLNSRPNKNGESDNSQNSYPIGNTRGWGISQYLSCDHRKISSIEQNKNNFDRVPSKSILKVGNLFQNKIVSKNSDLLNDYSNKQDQSIVEDQPEVSISNTPSNHNNHEKVDLIKDYENNSTKKTIEMQKVCFKLTNSQCLPTNNIDISQFSKKINDKKELEIHNKVSEKHCDVMKTSKSYTTPYYSTLNSYRSDIGNDSSNSQYAFGENISAIRRHSTFDRAPYYHSVEESNPLHGGLSKYLYCSSSTSGSSEFITKNLSSIVSNSIFKDSFGFCHRRFDKKTQLDTSSISHSNSKLSFEKEKRVERNSKYNFSAKTPENTEIESTSKTDDFSFKLNTLMREKDIITYDLKAIIDFCLSLNIPPKTEMNHKDVPATSFDENKIESNYKIHKIYDEIVLNMMKTMIKTFPPKEAVEDIYKSNIDNGNSGLIQSILCPKHKHKQNGNDTFKNVIQGYNSKKIVNKSVEFRSHISNTDFLKNESHLIENRDPEFFRDFQSFQNKVEKSPIEGTSNSDHVPRTNMNSSNRNKNGLLLDESGVNENSLHKDLVISNQNSNQCKPLSHFKECDQVQKVLGYQDSHTFQNNPSLQNHEEIDFGNSAKKADDPPISLDNVFINEDDNFHNPTSSWNISDRQKYFKLTSTLRTAITYLNTIDKQGDLDKSKSSVRKSMTDRDKFKYFSNFLKESVIKRENILKQLEIVPFKNVSVTSESDPLPCLGNKSTDVHISSLINLNCKQIELSNNTFKELENQTSNNGDVLKILELRENSDIHIPDEQSIERKYLGTALNIGLLENISPSDASKLPIKNNSELLSNHLSTSSNQKNDCVSLKKVGDASTLGGGSQSYLSLNGSSENSSNGLNKFESLLRHSSSSDTKTKFFKSLKLSACRQISNYSVKSEITSEHTQSLNYSESFPDVSEFDEKIVNKGRLSISSVYPQNSLPKVLSRGKIAFPEILENYCVLQERDLAAKGEGHLKEESGNYLEEITTETRSKTIQKQNSKSKLSKTSVDNESYSTVIGTNNFGKLSGDCSTENSRYNSPGKKLNFDDENASETINVSLNETSKSNRNIAQANDESFVISLFPLINLRKSHLKYEACVEPVINISYESLCKNVLSSLPSVGKILSETLPAAARAALERWKQNMIAQLGEEGFQKLNKENLARGALFHEYVRRYLVGETSNDDLPEKVQYYFKSLAAVFPHISDVKVVESHVTHPQLHYCGFIDCVAKYDGTPVVIEWKLAEKPKPDIRSTYDAPLQMSAYLGALNYDDNYNFPVASGVVVAAYTDGSPANVFYLPQEKCVTYWESFQKRLQEYKKMKSVKLK